MGSEKLIFCHLEQMRLSACELFCYTPVKTGTAAKLRKVELDRLLPLRLYQEN